MFGYTVFLKIGNLAASSLTDMYKDSYQLIGCEFGFAQGIDIKGQAGECPHHYPGPEDGGRF